MDKIIDRVRKLLALAGNNPSEAEAEAAMAKAFALMAEHQIDMEAVQAAQAKATGMASPGVEIVRETTETNLSEIYWRYLWHAVAQLNGCTYFYTRPNLRRRLTRHTVIGNPAKVIATKMMAEYLCQAGRRLANEAVGTETFGPGRPTKARVFNSFLNGFGSRIFSRLAAMRRDAETGNLKSADGTRNLPALLSTYQIDKERQDAWLKQCGIVIREARKGRALDVDPAQYAKGRAAGDKVNLASQLRSPSGG